MFPDTCIPKIFRLKKECQDFPGGSVFKNFPHTQGTQVQLLVQELRSHMTQGNLAHMHHTHEARAPRAHVSMQQESSHEKPKPLLTTTTEKACSQQQRPKSHPPANVKDGRGLDVMCDGQK